MKITKLAHACLLVEMPAPTNRSVLFDPGSFSVDYVKAAHLQFLDDIIITHEHFDHFNKDLVIELAQKFPEVRILAPQSVVDVLRAEGVKAGTEPADGLQLFDSPHEPMDPLSVAPAAIGVHYLDILSHPGDSHHFSEAKQILALPITAPWGSTTNAVKLADQLKPKIIIPIHDGFWIDSWRAQMYGMLGSYFEKQGIEFMQPVNGEPFVLNLEQAQPA
jgi:L-ascorbate metabolism protein UlaG (beta-lactamase superfamily)